MSYFLPFNSITVRAEDKVNYIYKLDEKVPEYVIDSLIAKYATGTKAYQMKRTLFCESMGFKNIQSKIINKKGVREDSWGIAQINLYWNNNVSKEQALNPEFAIKWMSNNWTKSKWYGYFKNTDTCNNIYEQV